jgi:thymidylate synthase
MRNLFCNTCGKAHEDVVTFVYENGIKSITEDNEHVIEVEHPLSVIINSPLDSPLTSSKLGVGEKFLEAYRKSLVTIRLKEHDNTDPTYTYGNRLCDYPFPIADGFGGDGDDEYRGLNQIDEIIERLKASSVTRRALAITWIPWIDCESNEPPCLQLIWFKIDSKNKLNMVSIFRSNDVLSALGQNLYALTHLFEYVYDNLTTHMHVNYGINHETSIIHKYNVGTLTHIILSPHLYYVRDAEELKRFL